MTPPHIVELAREVLGVIDLDPASSEEANKIIKARRFFTKKDNGLLQDWGRGSIFLNPPGGRTPSDSKFGYRTLPQLFWQKLVLERMVNDGFQHAIFIGYTIEILQTSQNKEFPCVMDYPFCVPKSRIKFINPGPNPKTSPTHANVIAYVPGNQCRIAAFQDAFEQIGKVIVP